MDLELPVDHVAFGTVDLAGAIEIVTASGLPMTPIGEVQWPGDDGAHTARAVSVVLAGGYLDIIEYDGAEGVLAPTGVVLRATDIASMRARLLQAGIRCGRPYVIVRRFFGAAPDQRYTTFGTDTRHSCGLPQSVITTEPAAPMQNTDERTADVVSLDDGARRLGVDLSA